MWRAAIGPLSMRREVWGSHLCRQKGPRLSQPIQCLYWLVVGTVGSALRPACPLLSDLDGCPVLEFQLDKVVPVRCEAEMSLWGRVHGPAFAMCPNGHLLQPAAAKGNSLAVSLVAS